MLWDLNLNSLAKMENKMFWRQQSLRQILPLSKNGWKKTTSKNGHILSNAWSLLEANWQNLKSFRRKLCGLMSLKFSPISWKQSTMLDIHKIDIQETPSPLSDMMLWSYSSAEAARSLFSRTTFLELTTEGTKQSSVSNKIQIPRLGGLHKKLHFMFLETISVI